MNGKITLYTAVPSKRIFSIAKNGLLTNDKVSKLEEFVQDEDLQGRVFDESSFGYIYASRTLENAVEWVVTIRMQTGDNSVIMEYQIDDNLIEPDKCSPNKSYNDIRFKGEIKPEDITVVNGEIKAVGKGKYKITQVNRISLTELYNTAKIRCGNCGEFTRYKDMIKFMGDMLICKECAEEAKEFALEIGVEEPHNQKFFQDI